MESQRSLTNQEIKRFIILLKQKSRLNSCVIFLFWTTLRKLIKWFFSYKYLNFFNKQIN